MRWRSSLRVCSLTQLRFSQSPDLLRDIILFGKAEMVFLSNGLSHHLVNELVQSFSMSFNICVPGCRLICAQCMCKFMVAIVNDRAVPQPRLDKRFLSKFRSRSAVMQLPCDHHVKWPSQNHPELVSACNWRATAGALQYGQWHANVALESQSKCHDHQHAQGLWLVGIAGFQTEIASTEEYSWQYATLSG